jgi:hypothetical protein
MLISIMVMLLRRKMVVLLHVGRSGIATPLALAYRGRGAAVIPVLQRLVLD